MTPLRQRMVEDMQIRHLSPLTQRSYTEHVSRFARHFGRSPALLGPAEIRAYRKPAGGGNGGTRGGSGTSKGPAYSYLSVVDGAPMRHSTWAECERRVTGRSGAKFKKATSEADQAAILRSWRFEPGDV